MCEVWYAGPARLVASISVSVPVSVSVFATAKDASERCMDDARYSSKRSPCGIVCAGSSEHVPMRGEPASLIC